MACKHTLDEYTSPARLMPNGLATILQVMGGLAYLITIIMYGHQTSPSVHDNVPQYAFRTLSG